MQNNFETDFNEMMRYMSLMSRLYPETGNVVRMEDFKAVSPLPDTVAKYYLKQLRDGNWNRTRFKQEVKAYKARKKSK